MTIQDQKQKQDIGPAENGKDTNMKHKIIMENWKSFIDDDMITEENLQLYQDIIYEQLVKEGILQKISSKSSNALKAMALAFAVLAPMAPTGGAEAAPKAKIEQMVVKGKMTDAQKKKLAQSDRFLDMELRALNEHLESERITGLDRSSRDMSLRMLGATSEDFPMGQEVTKEELIKFLLTGESPGQKEPEEEEEEDIYADSEYMKNVDAFLDDAEDAGRQMKGAAKKGVEFLKNLFETFEADTTEDKIESIMTDIDNALYYNDNTSDLPERDLDTIRKHVKMALLEIFEK